MKTAKKLLALLVVAVMLAAILPTALAASTTYSITITNNAATKHTYEAYQIFTGTLTTTGEGENAVTTLSDIVWGSGVSADVLTALGSAADVAAKLQNGTTSVVEFGKSVNGYLDTVAGSDSEPENGQYVISNLPAGYYLVKDRDGSLGNANDAYTQYLIRVVKNVTAEPKSAMPTVDKEVYDEPADAEDGEADGWGESADHAINESFQFKLTASLPADTDFGAYETYKVVFNDTMSAGVTFESIDSVTVDRQTLAADGYSCTAKTGDAGTSWTLTIDNIKGVTDVNLNDGADIVVIYNAHLNEKAQVNHESGSTTNKNDVYLEFSNNPNAIGTGQPEMGRTPVDSVWVFTYEVDNTKVDATDSTNKTPLAGAGFRLYDSASTTEIGLIYDSSISAYRPIKSGETPVEMKSADSTGVFNIKGLDAGTYILKETTVPAGYNKCDDYTVVISATHAEDASGTSATTTLSDTSKVTNTIENKKGSTLPETGGIGTTLFYVIGSILVIGAVVLLVSKKRMSTAD